MQVPRLKQFSLNDALLIGALLIASGLVWNTITTMQRNYRLQQEYNQLKAEVELREVENQNLRYTINYLKSDGYLEQAARAKFSKALPGETLVTLPNSGEAEQAPVAQQVITAAPVSKRDWKSNIHAWWNFLRGKTLVSTAK